MTRRRGMSINLRVPHVGRDPLNAALAALQTLNELWLRAHPSAPGLYESGVWYQPETASEDWLTVPDILRYAYAGRGADCEDLAAWRAAELRVSGADPGARAVAYQSGPSLWHAVVMLGSGEVEDPSLALGMGWHPGLIAPGDDYA